MVVVDVQRKLEQPLLRVSLASQLSNSLIYKQKTYLFQSLLPNLQQQPKRVVADENHLLVNNFKMTLSLNYHFDRRNANKFIYIMRIGK